MIQFCMQKIIQVISAFSIKIFGEFQHTKPEWLNQLLENVKKNPVAFKKLSASLVLTAVLLTGGYYAKSYYDQRPQPNLATFKVEPLWAYDFYQKEVRSLSIKFDRSVADVNLIGRDLKEFIKLKPEIKGQWIWASDRELKFTPLTEKGKIDWSVGTRYSGSLNRKLFTALVILKETDFEFETAQIEGQTEQSSFYQDPRFADNKKVIATFNFNYPVDPEAIKKRIKLLEKIEDGLESESKTEFAISFDDLKSKMFVQSARIGISEKNKLYKYAIASGVSSVFGGSSPTAIEAIINVPSLYDYFKFTNSSVTIIRNEKFESEQILRLENISELASEELAKTLTVYELPVLNPDLPPTDEESKRKQNYQWTSVSEVTAKILEKSKKLNLDLIPSEKNISLNHAFKFSANPGRFLYVKIPQGMTSFGGFKLKDDYENVILVPQYPTDIQIMGSGSLIPLSGSKQISLVSRNVNKINYQIHQIRLEQLNHLIPGLIGQFAKPSEYDIRPDSIAERFSADISVLNKNPQKTQFSSIDLTGFLSSGKKGIFYISLQSQDSVEPVSDQRFIILTDLGMVIKKSVAGSYDIFVQNITTGLPVAGAKVSVLGQNGINILSSVTTENGSVSFPSLKDFKNDKMPIAFVAQSGDSISFVPFESYSREIDFSTFDIGGIRDNSSSDELSAFAFSDRGLYRPGEEVDFGLVVRSKNWNKSFTQIPVDIAIQNSSGQEIYKQTIKVSSHSLENIHFKTEDYFQTGQYTLYIYVKDKNKYQSLIGSTRFQVEEFMPDQIKVSSTLSKNDFEGWVNPKDLSLNVTAFSLYGKPATNRVVLSNLKIKPADVFFKKWKDYFFTTPKVTQLEINDNLPQMLTNDNGEASWKLNVENLEKSIYRLFIQSEVFETEGGKSIKSQLSQLISTQDYLLGINSKKVDLSFIKKNSPAPIDLIAVNSKLDAVALDSVNIEIIEKKPTSVLTKLPNETWAYQTIYKETVISQKKINVREKGSTYNLQTDLVGEFILVFKDKDQIELNRLVFNIVGDADLDRGLEKSSFLKLGLNKKDYKPAEEIEVQIKSPYIGAGLITIERDKVYVSQWFKSTSKSSIQKIKIPAGLEGQAYVVVTMLRDSHSQEIYTSPLAYGVSTFAIDLEARKSKIELNVPEKIKPGQKLTFKVRSDQKTKAAVYLVDEGILQVASYKLPKPLDYFFQKKALQVSTAQILDQVMPDFISLKDKAAGGDQGSMTGQSLNPFKRKNLPPTAAWLGIKDISENWTTYIYSVPDYFNGNLKLMVVTADEKKLGSISTDINVQGDFIINATSTTFSSPGDEFEVNLIIANLLKGSGTDAKLNLSVKTEKGFEMLQKQIESLLVPEGKEKVFNFRLKATDQLGSFPIYIKTGIGDKNANLEINILNRPATPYIQKIDWLLVADQPFNLEQLTQYRPEYKKNYLQAHSVIQDLIQPFSSFYEVNDYLCTEQIASQLMPLVLRNDKSNVELNKVNRLISLLRARQKVSGEFILYPNDSSIHLEATLHLGMIFLYMQEKGEPVANDLWQRFLQSLKSGYNSVQTKMDLYRKAKAMYILVRSQTLPKEDFKNISQLMKDKNFDKLLTPTTAYYFASAYKLAMQDDISKKFIELARVNKNTLMNESYAFEDAENFEKQALILQHFSQDFAGKLNNQVLTNMITEVSKQSLNTFSSSYLLMSLDSILKQNALPGKLDAMKITTTDDNKIEKQIDFKDLKSKRIDFVESFSRISIANKNTNPILLSYVQAGFDQQSIMKQKYSGIEISRTYTLASQASINKVDIGTEINVSIRARTNLEKESSILITDLIPAGFEVVLNSIRKNEISNSDAEIQNPSDEPMDQNDSSESTEGANNWPVNLLLNRAWAKDTSSIAILWPKLVDVREDRVNLYVQLNRDMKEFTYKMKAIAKGRYLVPGIYAKGLYRTSLTGQSDSGQIEVK